MLKKDILNKCRDSIRDELGTIDDLPPELANTVANVYYRFLEYGEQGEGGVLDRLLEQGPEAFIGDTAQIVSDRQMVVGFVKDLRRTDWQQHPNLYRYTIEFILDILKDRIPNAHEKTGIRRMIERRFRKNRVQEIPNLVDTLNRMAADETPTVKSERRFKKFSPEKSKKLLEEVKRAERFAAEREKLEGPGPPRKPPNETY